MNASLYQTLREIIRDEIARTRTVELAVVEEQHPHGDEGDTDNYACSVVLRNSGIVLKKVPVATQMIGQASIPSVGDLVLVQFINGDINAPIINGRLYNDEDRPPVNQDQGHVFNLPAASGEEGVLIDVSGNDRAITLTLGSGLVINLKDDDPVVEIDVDGGAAGVVIQRDGAMQISSGGDLAIEANNIDITASGEMNLQGSTINLN